MRRALTLIDQAFRDHRPALMYSGGFDSSVLLHLVYRQTEHRPPVIYVHNEIQNPLTLEHVKQQCDAYGAHLTVATPDRTALEQWAAQGWPILGGIGARQWTARYKHLGVRLNCEACCNRMKIRPGRDATKQAACDAQLTGLRASDDQNRGRVIAQQGQHYLTAGLMVYHPIAHWTDVMVRRYIRQHSIPRDPSTAGQQINGCRCCAGGWKFDNNKLVHLRRDHPDQWREFVVDQGAWLPLLVVKHKRPVAVIRAAVARLGGIEAVAERYPHVFDYGQVPPLRSYRKD
jgi:3'-phosphoadenosine 5'-phosphosulfate sulfotransferase (PAPS reductase)/FAD synthetase